MVKILKVLGEIPKVLVKIARVLPRKYEKTEPVFSFFRYFQLEKRKNEKLVFSYFKTKKSDTVFFFLWEKLKKRKKWSRFSFLRFLRLEKTKTKKMAHFFHFFVIRSEKMKNWQNWLGLSIIGTAWNISFFFCLLGHFLLDFQKTSNFACYSLKNE